ncbi:MAG TPA: phosphate ABC transporter substrate-binding protein PstS [Polyangiaceae bacterium]|nr:phosphate ABC transporter substrate-binding protein PstS [Polyangiaceae bacterium]
MTTRRALLLGSLAASAIWLATACNKSSPPDERASKDGEASRKQDAAKPAAAKGITLNGAGATFPFPLYSKWMSEYNKANPDVRINYQSIGSGGGIRQVVAGTVDFGATDAPMKEEESKGAPGKLVHIPATLGSVVVAYNLEGVSGHLNLTSEALSGIFLGTVKKWNDKKISAQNPGVKLPNQDIAVVFRTDGSGTTAVFTEYLSTVNPAFKEKVGAGKSVKWPAGLGAKGNEGVTGQVKTTPGAIGYMELAYATQSKLPTAAIQNKASKFVAPSAAGATAAAESVEMSEALHVSLADAAGEAAYPIASYTYLLVYEDSKDSEKGQALAKFLWWALNDGQRFAADLDYAPLPDKVQAKVRERLKTLSSGGKRLLDGV